MFVRRRQTAARPPRRLRRRKGVLTVELILTLPILLFVLFAVLEFGLLFFARSSVVQASRTAARQAALQGTSEAEIEEQVRAVLSPGLQPGLMVHFAPGERSGEPVSVGVEIPMTNAAPDLLWPIGYSLRGRSLYAETTFIQE